MMGKKEAFSFGNVFTNYFLRALAQGKRRLCLHSIINFKRSAVIKASSLQVHPTRLNPWLTDWLFATLLLTYTQNKKHEVGESWIEGVSG